MAMIAAVNRGDRVIISPPKSRWPRHTAKSVNRSSLPNLGINQESARSHVTPVKELPIKEPETARSVVNTPAIKQPSETVKIRNNEVTKTNFTSAVSKKVFQFESANKTWGNVGKKIDEVGKLGVKFYGGNFHQNFVDLNPGWA